MNPKWVAFARAILLLTAVAAVSSLVTARVLSNPARHAAPDYHAWIHEKLAMTDRQERKLEPSERRYNENKRHLTEVIRLANQELALAISEDRANSPRVQAAVRRIHQAMGELQQSTLDHIFEMKDVLEPQQYDTLIELTKEALEVQGGKK